MTLYSVSVPHMNLSESLAAEIESRRELIGITPRQLAYRLDISEASLSHRKNGHTAWSWVELEAVAEIFAITVSGLILSAEARTMASAS